MGSLSNFLENELIDHVFGGGAYTPPATVYLALATADPGEAGPPTEPSGNGYAREAITFGAAASRQIVQSAQVNFDQATGSWGTITHYAIMDALTSGNMMAYGALSVSKEVVAGNTPSVAASEVVISFNTGAIFNYLAHKLLDLAFRNQAYSAPTIYIGLSTTVPNDDGTNITEPGSGNYARKAHATWGVASGGATSNTGDITFNIPSGTWGLITYGTIHDALTVGNPLWRGDVTDQTPNSGDTVKFPSGDLDVSLD